MKKIAFLIITLCAIQLFAVSGSAQCVSLTTLGSASTQGFDTLSNVAGSTTNNLTITGWFLTESGGGARDNEQYAVDNGTSTTGDMHSYGATAATDRALGSLRSGTLIPLFGACYTNNTGSTIGSLAVAYTGEEWRLGTAARTDQLTFEYSTNATDLVTGVWTGVPALNFVTPVTATTGAKDGNVAANRTAISSTITGLSVPNGATFWIRFNDPDVSGADDGLAVDDFSLTPNGAVVTPNLTVNDVSVNEGNSGTTSYSFTVSLSSPAPAGGVTFDIATADGAATSPSDFASRSLTAQTIPAGSSTYSFTVLGNGDTILEPNEAFFVNVTNVTGAVVADGQGQGTIVNDDSAPTISAGTASIQEGNSGTSVMTFAVSMTGGVSGGMTVNYATSDITATIADNDYVASSGTLTFAGTDGEIQFVSVTVNGDTTIESNESLGLVLSSPSVAGTTLVNGVGTITNDDVALPTISFENANYSEDESQTMTVNVVRSGNTAGVSTVDYTTLFAATSRLGGTIDATPGATCGSGGVDFVSQVGTLTFAADELIKTINIPICGDVTTEPTEGFPLTLSNPSNAELSGNVALLASINDTASQFTNANDLNIGSSGDAQGTSIGVELPATNISGVRVTLYDLQISNASNLDVLLVGPGGQKFLLMADAGGPNGLSTAATVTFSDTAGQVLPQNDTIISRAYEPTTWEANQSSFTAPAPAGPYVEPGNVLGGPITLASTFGNTNPNGVWRVYVRDDLNSFSPLGLSGQAKGWGIQFLVPTAAGVTVEGRVANGKAGVANATVTITGGGLVAPLSTRTNQFGGYRFEGLAAGQTYIVTVNSRRYFFIQPTIVVNVEDNVAGLDFEAQER